MFLAIPSRFYSLVFSFLAFTLLCVCPAYANHYTVDYLGRSYDAAKDTTTFSYQVSGTGLSPALSHLTAQIPKCSPGLKIISTDPGGGSLGLDPTTSIYGIKWDFGLGTNATETYSYTIKGDIPEGDSVIVIKAGQLREHYNVKGAACLGSQKTKISGHTYLQGSLTPIPGVSVTANILLGATSTDSNGFYSYSNVPNGNYVLSASKPGYIVVSDPNPVNVAGTDLFDLDFILACDVGFSVIGNECLPNPNIITITASDGTFTEYVEVIWTTDTCAATYKLYRALTGGDVFANEVTFAGVILALNAASQTFLDTSAVPGVIYDYAAVAIDSNGQACNTTNIDPGHRLGGFNDCDGDGISDEDEIAAGTDPCDPGSNPPKLKGPIFAKWNTFLTQFNYLELIANGTAVVEATVTAIDIQGNDITSVAVTLNPGEQQDIDINTLTGMKDTYGLVRVEWNDDIIGADLIGRLTNYRPDPNNLSFSFAFSKDLINPTRGMSYATGNSVDPQGNGFLVPNWTEIQNVSDTEQWFTYNLYNQAGSLLETHFVLIPPFGERDLNGGHENGEGVYLAEVIPHNGAAQYFMTVSRYSSNHIGSDEADTCNYAFARQGQSGTADGQFASISNEVGECFSQTNWVEVVNVREVDATANIIFRSQDGTIVGSTSQILKPRSQYHYNASALLPKGTRGTIELSSDVSGSLLMQSITYYHDCENNNTQTAYMVQGALALAQTQTGTYNRFLDIHNELSVFNITLEDISYDIEVRSDGVQLYSSTDSLNSQSGTQFNLNDEGVFSTEANSYGTVQVTSGAARQIVADILRKREDPTRPGAMDFVIPTSLK